MGPWLGAVDDREIRHAVRDGLANLYEATNGGRRVPRDRVTREVLRRLATSINVDEGNASAIANRLNKAYARYASSDQGTPSSGGEHEDNLRIEAEIWNLIRRGLIYPRHQRLLDGNPPPAIAIEYLVVTPAGRRAFELVGGGRPSQPDFIDRVLGGVGLPSDILGRFQDAHDCYSTHLLRAAVVLLGLAYEAIAAEVYDAVEHKVSNASLKRDAGRGQNKARIEAISAVREVVLPKDEPARLVLNIAEDVRLKRNDAAHNWQRGFDDAEQVEDMLLGAVRRAGDFWRLKTDLA